MITSKETVYSDSYTYGIHGSSLAQKLLCTLVQRMSIDVFPCWETFGGEKSRKILGSTSEGFQSGSLGCRHAGRSCSFSLHRIFFLDGPLRSSMEKKPNSDLKGYSVRLTGLHFQLLDLSLTLKELTVVQQAHPDPPIASFPVLKASIHWREVLSGKFVAEFMLEQPRININLKQLRSERLANRTVYSWPMPTSV